MEMKQKYNLEIAGIQLSILSDESEDFVKELVAKLDTQITDLTVHNKRCAKIDAAILIALDALSEKIKLEQKLKNLEAQVALYEANLRRQRAEIAHEEKPVEAEAKADTEGKQDEAEKPKKAPARKKALQQLPLEEPAAKKEEAPAEKKEEASAPIRSDKIRQIESLLRTQSEDTPKSSKLAEIEQLLREGGKSSLAEALSDAADD